MVSGIEKFREYFAAHVNQYAIIGGTACDLVFDAAGLGFRATRDIDMVLCVEVIDAAFGRAFEGFLDAGGYQARERSTGDEGILSLPPSYRPGFPLHVGDVFRASQIRLNFPKAQS